MLLEVGKIDRPHGIRGDVLVSLSTNRDERVAAGAQLALKDGTVLTVSSSRPHQGRWIVQFEGVATREGAEALHGKVLLAEPIDDPDSLWIHELIGATVVDGDGRDIGVVRSVEDNPASDLLVLDEGVLIPLRFVVDRDRATGRLTVDLPEGLLDL